ncbi:MAG: hypothetical protein WAW23_00270, partial [Candidatus Methanoperedens sp.]
TGDTTDNLAQSLTDRNSKSLASPEGQRAHNTLAGKGRTSHKGMELSNANRAAWESNPYAPPVIHIAPGKSELILARDCATSPYFR